MEYLNEKLWRLMEFKAYEQDEGEAEKRKIANAFIEGVKKICNYAIIRSKLIVITFPFYTLHDETHICNILNLMALLLGNRINDLSRDEAAMLILAACCHDIGMSYSDDEKQYILSDKERLNRYLEEHPSDYVKAFISRTYEPIITDEIIHNFFRTIHHERVRDLLYLIEWPEVLEGYVDRNNLINVCTSHGLEISKLIDLNATPTIDLRFCAILLRLADILDFDMSRTPKALYDFNNIEKKSGTITKSEWLKHFASRGFNFSSITYDEPYQLPYSAICKNIKIEYLVQNFINWIDYELNESSKQLSKYSGKWSKLILPEKIDRRIIAEGYVSGEFRFTLAQDHVLNLLAGNELYDDCSVFVRELLQNAIDSVRTREKFIHKPSWKPQIKIKTWMDEKGDYWFRIDDNGLGMTQKTIINYFLKIGCSYYNSDEFKKDIISKEVDQGYMPISRFGIGILSCFIGGEAIELSTKYYDSPNSSLRLSINGMDGYYFLTNKDLGHQPDPMPGTNKNEKYPYRIESGTTIVVRTNVNKYRKFNGFKEIVSKYVIFPSVPVYYSGPDGELNFACQSKFIDIINKSDNVNRYTMTDLQMNELKRMMPYTKFEEIPSVELNCTALDNFTSNPYLSGAILTIKSSGKSIKCPFLLDNISGLVQVNFEIAKELLPEIYLKFSYDINTKSKKFKEGISKIIEDFARKINRSETYVHLLLEAVRQQEGLKYNPITIVYKYMLEKHNINLSNELNEHYCELLSILNSLEMVVMTNKKMFITNIINNTLFEFFNHNGNNMIISHNGIYVESSIELISDNAIVLGGFLLLSDKLRPNHNIARNTASLTLEIAIELLLTIKRAHNFNNLLNIKAFNFDFINLEYINTNTWLSFFSNNAEIFKLLRFETDMGALDIKELDSFIEKKGGIFLKPFLYLYKRNSDFYLSDLIDSYLKTAALIQYYDLYTDIDLPYIYVRRKKGLKVSNFLYELPIILSINILSNNIDKPVTCFAYDTHSFRTLYNTNHPFFLWLINNIHLINTEAPGIKREILSFLLNSKNNSSEINTILDRLRAIPNNPFSISNEIYLVESDFIFF